MKLIAADYTANYRRDGASDIDPGSDILLAKIGDDLRDAYRDSTQAEPPQHLVQLAREIEARLGSES